MERYKITKLRKESVPVPFDKSANSLVIPSISDGGTSYGTEISAFTFTKSYKRRFWILFIFSTLSWFQCLQWNTWGPISASMTKVFNWSPQTVAMMGNWGSLSFLVFVWPMCLYIQRTSVRQGVIACSLSISFGPLLRWITFDTSFFTFSCHVSSILNGIAGTVLLSAPPTIAAEWFPPHQRTTATAMIQGCNAFGAVGSYLEPMIVREPTSNLPDKYIREDILHLMVLSAVFAVMLLFAVLIYFPSKPPCPPSFTSSIDKVSLRPAVKNVLRNMNVFPVVLSFGMTVGGTAAWGGVLNYSVVNLGLDQNAAMYVGMAAAFASGVLRLTAGRFTDLAYGHLKITLLIINLMSLACYYWFFLISYGTIPPTKWQIYVSIVSGIGLTFSTAPLYFELAVENAYPCLEVVVGGVASFINNLFSSIFLCLFFIPGIGNDWMIYCILVFGCLSLIPLVAVKETYGRSQMDSSPVRTPKIVHVDASTENE